MSRKKMPFTKVDHPLYVRYLAIRKRCLSPRDKQFKLYGGAGIGLSDSWLKFEKFCEDMGMPPNNDLSYTIDRIDNNKGYSKENCRLATMLEQSRNKRNTGMCRKGHLYSEVGYVPAHNGRSKTRRCALCIMKNKPKQNIPKDKL